MLQYDPLIHISDSYRQLLTQLVSEAYLCGQEPDWNRHSTSDRKSIRQNRTFSIPCPLPGQTELYPTCELILPSVFRPLLQPMACTN